MIPAIGGGFVLIPGRFASQVIQKGSTNDPVRFLTITVKQDGEMKMSAAEEALVAGFPELSRDDAERCIVQAVRLGGVEVWRTGAVRNFVRRLVKGRTQPVRRVYTW